MISINIDNETCIRCSKCVKVCPELILTQEGTKAEIGLQNIQSCIVCGHCVDVCPTDSVLHSEFPEQKVHFLKRNLLPTPEQVMELLRARRSNRAFLSNPIPLEYLHRIVEAAHLSPTASNEQELSYTLVTNANLLEQISEITINVYEKIVSKLGNPILKPIVNTFSAEAKHALPMLEEVIKRYRKDKYDVILRDAKAVLFIHAHKRATFGRQDANLAYQNASLMAESLGVSQFYTGYVCSAADLDKFNKRLVKLLNIDGKIHAGMALAMPAFKFAKYSDRSDLKLNIFE